MKTNKYNIGDRLFYVKVDVGQNHNFIHDFIVEEIAVVGVSRDIKYRDNGGYGILEDKCFPNFREAYKFILDECEEQMTRFAHIERFSSPPGQDLAHEKS